jgi:hypothetical protein
MEDYMLDDSPRRPHGPRRLEQDHAVPSPACKPTPARSGASGAGSVAEPAPKPYEWEPEWADPHRSRHAKPAAPTGESRLTGVEKQAIELAASLYGKHKRETVFAAPVLGGRRYDWNNAERQIPQKEYDRHPEEWLPVPETGPAAHWKRIAPHRPYRTSAIDDYFRRVQTRAKFGDLSGCVSGDIAVFTTDDGVTHAWSSKHRFEPIIATTAEQRGISRRFDYFDTLMREPAGGHNYGCKRRVLGGADNATKSDKPTKPKVGHRTHRTNAPLSTEGMLARDFLVSGGFGIQKVSTGQPVGPPTRGITDPERIQAFWRVAASKTSSESLTDYQLILRPGRPSEYRREARQQVAYEIRILVDNGVNVRALAVIVDRSPRTIYTLAKDGEKPSHNSPKGGKDEMNAEVIERIDRLESGIHHRLDRIELRQLDDQERRQADRDGVESLEDETDAAA